uniref:HTH psq-type domain-containing protein n=1 Tax=Plectus sambesii TaxID=2011161 RepID=A0A914XAC5_9BILA
MQFVCATASSQTLPTAGITTSLRWGANRYIYRRTRLRKGVVTDNATASEAARTYQIPPSTIQPYVQRARAALGMPIYSLGTSPTTNGLLSKKNGALGTPKIYAKPGEEATEDDVFKVVQQVVSNCNAHESRRGKLLDAVFAAVAGKSTIKDACTSQGLPASTVHPYVSRARHILGDKCPTPKTIAVSSTAGSSSGAPSPAPSLSGDEDNNNSLPIIVKGGNVPSAKKGGADATDVVALPGDRGELRAQLVQIMGRYNFRGDRTRMVDAIAMVIGENKTLADVSQSTGLAQTTLSTYVRLAKLFLKPKPTALDDDDDEAAAIENECPPPNITIGVDIDAATDKDAQPAQAVTSSAVSPDAGAAKELKEKSVMVLLDDPDENDQETRFRVVVSHLVSQQFKRGASAQQKMTDAVEDVLLNGLSVAESLKIHGGMSEHVLNVYVKRTRDVLSCFDDPLTHLLSVAARVTQKKSPSRRRSSLGPTSPQLSPTTPTRSSRRLQARQSAEHHPDTTVSSCSSVDDSPVISGGEQQLPAEFEVALVEYFK